MKKFLFMFTIFTVMILVAPNSHALSFDEALNKVSNGDTKSLDLDKVSDKIVKQANEKVDKAIADIQKKADDKIAKYQDIADKEIAKVQDKIDEKVGEIDKFVEDAKSKMNFFEQIRAKAMKYVKIASTVLALLSSGILVIIFFMWKIWKTVKSAASLKFAFDHKKYDKKLAELEKEIKELKKLISKK